MLVKIEAIVRPEKTEQILAKLAEKGHTAVTRMDVYGRGKQAGIHIGDVFYDELPKELLFLVAEAAHEKEIVDVITTQARTNVWGITATAEYSYTQSKVPIQSVAAQKGL